MESVELSVLQSPYSVLSVAAGGDGNWFVSGGQGPVFRLWDVRSAKVQKTFKLVAHSVNAIAISDNNFLLAEGGGKPDTTSRKYITLWDVRGKKIRRLGASTRYIN